MALDPPELDNRRFDDLLAEARLRIPRYTPEWTDFNDSDPGMTLVQLFAWFTETMLFQMNKVPDLHYVRFLDMLGFAPRPAEPARAVVVFDVAGLPLFDVPQLVPAGTRSDAVADRDGNPIVFETVRDLPLVRLPLAHLSRRAASGKTLEDITQLNEARGQPFLPFAQSAEAGSELWLGLATTAGEVTEAFAETIPFYVDIADAGARAQVSTSDVGRPNFDRILEGAPQPGALEFWAIVALKPDAGEAPIIADQEPLEIVDDDTKHLQQSGFITVRRPVRAGPIEEVAGERALWIVVRVHKSYGYGSAPLVTRLSMNAVEAVARQTIEDELLERSDGTPGQTRVLEHAPVAPGSLTLRIGDEDWPVVRSLFEVAGEPAVALDPGRGELTFGDNEHGLIPPPGEEIRVVSYRAGGGQSTNLEAGQVNIAFQTITGANPEPARGGRDAESIDEVKRRAPARLRHLDRAVTIEDYQSLAIERAGMARAKVKPRFNPDFPESEVAGAVTVLVVPPIAPNASGPPLVSDLELARIAATLDTSRMVGTEIFVRRPRVIPVQVRATVDVQPGVTQPELEAESRRVLNAFLNAEERGFGGILRRGRLWAELLKVPFISSVIRLDIDIPIKEKARVSEEEFQESGSPNDEIIIDDDAIIWGRPDHEIDRGTSALEVVR